MPTMVEYFISTVQLCHFLLVHDTKFFFGTQLANPGYRGKGFAPIN